MYDSRSCIIRIILNLEETCVIGNISEMQSSWNYQWWYVILATESVHYIQNNVLFQRFREKKGYFVVLKRAHFCAN